MGQRRIDRSGGKLSSKVVVMYGPFHGRKITQQDLAEERLLNLRAHEAVMAHHAKRDEIRKRLEAGAVVEPGLRTVDVILRRAMVIR